jgi:hypothetical protein
MLGIAHFAACGACGLFFDWRKGTQFHKSCPCCHSTEFSTIPTDVLACVLTQAGFTVGARNLSYPRAATTIGGRAGMRSMLTAASAPRNAVFAKGM